MTKDHEAFIDEHGRDPYSDQELHDFTVARRGAVRLAKGSKQRLQKLLVEKQAIATAFDPIASAMANNPGLTRERAEEMARNLGF
jgi:hypothetical protein